MSAGEAIVEVRDVRKVHAPGTAAEVRALDGVSFSIRRGAYVAIVGESGSGKTTLMHVLGALDRATSGSVCIAGRDLGSLGRGELGRVRAREIGFVFQGFNLVPTLDALENVELAAHYARRERTAARVDATRLLEEVGLGERLRHRPSQLSGGQQQRVAIARALVNSPSLILADEPTGELDTRTASSVLELFERFHRERGQTIVMVTHNPAVWQRCETVITLADGRIESIEERGAAAMRGTP
jgi:ABC-type lipoprotein export system ATPase subunit